MKKLYYLFTSKIALMLLTLFTSTNALAQIAGTQTFNFTGAVQNFTVPVCVSTMTVDAWGAQGATTTPGANGGLGGYLRGVISVTAGQVLSIYVGGQNGFNGGATGGINGNAVSSGATQGNGGNGGGASDIRVGGVALSNRIFIAGGGGGGGHNGTWTSCQTAGPAGAGGSGGLVGSAGLTGSSTACNCTNGGGNGGQGGTALAGGAAGTYNNIGCLQSWGIGSPGTLGNGGNGSLVYHNGTGGGGGGGGGYYGGGCGGSGSDTTPGGGGGGGSSFAGTSTNTLAASGQRSGDGLIVFTYNFNGAGVVVLPTSTAICSGASINLIANNVLSYTWSNSSNANSITVNPTSNTSYTVQGTNTLNCISTAIINVSVSAGAPVLSVVSSTNQTCLGKTATLTATGALTYTWSNNVSNGVSFSPSATTVYTVSGQNGCGTSTAVTTISVTPIAVSLVANPTVVCAGSSSTLTSVAAATSYSWFPVSASTTSIIVSPQLSTTYTLAVSDGTCSGLGIITLTALPIPTIVITPSVASPCSGVPVTLSASGGVSYTWTGNQLGASITVTPNTPTNYQVIGSNSVGCSNFANVPVITIASPTLTLISNNNLVCSGDPVVITASGANSYLWNNSSATSIITVNPLLTTIYTVTGTTNGCSTTETVSISVFIPTVAITGNTSICVGETSTLTASSANTYSWSNGFTSASIQVNPASTSIYSVSALTTSSGINCPSSASIQVSVKDNPTVTATASRLTMCKGENNTISVSGANSYSWNTNATTASFVITPTVVTTNNYSVIGTGTNACTATASVQVKINPCTGFDVINEKNISLMVYPNPNHGEFKVKAQQTVILKLSNELGQFIQTINLEESNNYETTIIGLSGGIYFITGSNSELNMKQKIIVTK